MEDQTRYLLRHGIPALQRFYVKNALDTRDVQIGNELLLRI